MNVYAGDFNDFKKSCDAGDAVGCSNVGLMYDRGQGVKQDYTKAMQFYKKACDMG